VPEAQSGSPEPPRGILDPGAVDSIETAADGVVELHIQQTAPWDGTDHLLLLTQEKLYNYLAHIADNELAGARVVLDCTSAPDERTRALLDRAAGELRKLGGSLVIRSG
jgi:hypothetical protein